MTDDLRDVIADTIVEAGGRNFSDPHELGHRPSVLAIADAVIEKLQERAMRGILVLPMP